MAISSVEIQSQVNQITLAGLSAGML